MDTADGKRQVDIFGIEPDLRIRVEKDIGIRIDNLSDLAKPEELAKAAANYICSDKSPRYWGATVHYLENLSSLIFGFLENGAEIGKSPPHNSKQFPGWFNRITEANFSHTQPFELSLALELSGRCPVPSNPPPSFAQWKAHLDSATNVTSKQYYDNYKAKEDIAVEAVDILLHAPPESRSEMLKTFIAEAENAFGKLTYKDSGEPLDRWDVILHMEAFSQEIIGNLISRAPKKSLSGQTTHTSGKVRGVLEGNEDKAA